MVKVPGTLPTVDPKEEATGAQAKYDFYRKNDWVEVYAVEPSMTRQEFKDEADINVLMANYERKGVMPYFPAREPVYLDWTQMPQSLLEFHEFIAQADEDFMRLPAVVRKEFDNDPYRFVEFASDPGNIDQLRQWGLAAPVAAPAAPATKEQTPAPPSAGGGKPGS